MARIRTIKPEFFTSLQVADLSTTGRLLFVATWIFADDAGIHPWSARLLKMEALPADDVSLDEIECHLQAMERVGLIRAFDAEDGQRYFAVTGWHHQRIDKPRYRYPQPDWMQNQPQFSEHSPNGRGRVADESQNGRQLVGALPETTGNDRKRPDTTGNDPRLPDPGPDPGPARAHARTREDRAGPAPDPAPNPEPAPEEGESASEEFDLDDPLIADAILRTVHPEDASTLARGAFAPLKESHLKSARSLREWHARQLSCKRPVVGDTEAHLLAVIAAGIYATRMRAEDVQRSRVAVFVGVVRKRAWSRVARYLPEARVELDKLRQEASE